MNFLYFMTLNVTGVVAKLLNIVFVCLYDDEVMNTPMLCPKAINF